MMPDRAEIEGAYRQLQDELVTVFEEIDGTGAFTRDEWLRPGGGGGVTRILAGGRHLEKAAVNFSAVFGVTPSGLSEVAAQAGGGFYATGVSVIVHPANPYAPTLHANLRFLEGDGGLAWFGGGADLTPYYLIEEDAIHFHRVLASVCSRHPVARYREWKQACDAYFFLPHRGEARGVGGLFFDRLDERLEEVWAFHLDLGSSLPEAYLPILERRVAMSHGDREKQWHRIRRGRYAEFNLVWDRGTRFGLETGGRAESVLASLPPSAAWVYDHRPEPGSDEAALIDVLRGPARWWG